MSVAVSIDAARRCRAEWQGLIDEALAGRASEAQGRREAFLRSLEAGVNLLTPEAVDEAASLGELLRKLRARWQTPEDLEDLAAESLTPSEEKMAAVEKKCGFPQAWYDDDGTPS